jgi:hypothetical protein
MYNRNLNAKNSFKLALDLFELFEIILSLL